MKKTIYDLDLHETLMVLDMRVMRVASGWLYDCWDIDNNRPQKGTFVPFDNEFQLRKI